MTPTPVIGKIIPFEQPSVADLSEEELASAPLQGTWPKQDIALDAQLGTLETEVLVGSLRDGRLQVCSPFIVKFATEGPHTVAEAVEFNEFGFGDNWSDALVDLQRAIAELYFTLEEEQARLGSDLQNMWAVLQQKIRRR